jgi:signal transduction histidine kinase
MRRCLLLTQRGHRPFNLISAGMMFVQGLGETMRRREFVFGGAAGLGLSMTHDIIVKQHGGRIDIDTKVGEFTEFIITLPRNNRTAVG